MSYKSSTIGNEISCVMYGINKEILNNTDQLNQRLLDALSIDNFTILGKVSHKFQPQGYTFVVLLAESHVAIHTYPEYDSIFFYLYSCRGQNDGRKTLEYLKQILKPSHINLNERPIIVKSTRVQKSKKTL